MNETITLSAYSSAFHGTRFTGDSVNVRITGVDFRLEADGGEGPVYRPVSDPPRWPSLGCGKECVCGGGSLIASGIGTYSPMHDAIVLGMFPSEG